MKKISIIVCCMLFSCLTMMAASKVGMLVENATISSIGSSDEKAAATWFQTAYPDGKIYTLSNISTLSTSDVNVLWVAVDRVGISNGWNNLPNAFKSTTTINALKSFVQAGGNLLLTNHATQLAVAIGRTTYAPNIFGSGNGSQNDDTWGVHPIIGNVDGQIYDHRSHDIYNGMTYHNELFSGIYCFEGAGVKGDHNCMWDMNAYTDLAENPNKIKDFENKTNSTVLGTWNHVEDYCCAGIVDFAPTTSYAGHILAVGLAAYEWDMNGGSNSYLNQLKMFTGNCIEYLGGEAPTETTPVVAGDRMIWVDMTLNGDNITDRISGNTLYVNNQKAQRENIDGAAGKALRLDGFSTYASGNIDVSELSTDKLTVSVWVAPESYPMGNNRDGYTGDDKYMFAGNVNGNTGFGFYVTTLGHYGFRYGGNDLYVGNETLPQYEWSHLVVTIDATGDATLYRNGSVKTDAWGETISTGGSSFFFGKPRDEMKYGDYHVNTFNGLIDDFEVFNRVLTATEVAAYTAENDADLSIPESRFADDIYRPRLHPMAGAGWGNETHGAMYSNGKFHVFYQKNPNGAYWGRLHWGHLTSENLFDWKEDRTAIIPDQTGYDVKGCWSGHVFQDASINDGKPTIVYTSVTGAPSISMATSNDADLRYWTKLSNNPRLGSLSGFGDFRDPSFFTANGNKYLIVGTTKNGFGAMSLHRYNNGSWTNNGTSFFQATNVSQCGSFWEMPNVTKVGDKYLVTATPLANGFSDGVKTIYWIGDINSNGTFNPTSGTASSPLYFEMKGMSKMGYGLLSPTFFEHDGKVLMIGIVPDKLSMAQNYQLGWAHAFSLPREITLSSDKKMILQKPYEGLKAMRSATETSETLTDFNLNGTKSLAPVSGRQFEICGEFTIGTSNFGYNFYKNGSKMAKLYYNANADQIVLDFSSTDHWTQEEGDYFHGKYTSDNLGLWDGDKVKIHLFVDHSIIDVFINDTWAFCVRMFVSDENANDVEVFADGTTKVNSLQAWNTENKTLTGIEAITIDDAIKEMDNDMRNDLCYDLAGRRLNGKPEKGFYIQNGKKYVAR